MITPWFGTPRLGRAAALLVVLTLLSACMPRPRVQLPEQRVELSDVPYFPQEQYQCGPAALATVLQHSGVEVTPEDLVGALLIPARQGSLQIELQAQARARERVPYVFQGDLQSLYAELRAGHPVLVLQNLAYDWAPVWHYAVVIGMDPSRGEVILRSGRESRKVVDQSVFERTWARAEHWALLALPADRLPAGAEPERVLQVAADLEQLGHWERVEQWYQAAAARWPQRPVFALGVANSRYARGDLVAAEQAYRRVIETFPHDAAAYNNLAWLLAEQQRWAEAERLITAGLALQGPLQDELRDTQRKIQCQGRPDCP